MTKILLLVCLVLIKRALGFNADDESKASNIIAREVTNFCAANGKWYVSITTLEQSNPTIAYTVNSLMDRSKAGSSLYSRILIPDPTTVDDSNKFPGEAVAMGGNILPLEEQFDSRKSLRFHKDSLVILTSSSDSSHWKKYMEWIVGYTKVATAMVVLVGDTSTENVNLLKSTLSNLKKSSFFYLAYIKPGSSALTWEQIITLNHDAKVVSSKLKFDPATGILIERYNLEGMMVFGQATNWAPFRKLSESCTTCSKLTRCPQCKEDGYLIDIVREFGVIQNFTWECHLEPNSNLGTRPVSGPADKTGEWGGVIGNVFGGDYHYSAGVYNARLERHDMFDMIPILFDSTLMIARPTPLDMDFGLLIRPYRREAWVMVGVTVAAIFAFLIVPSFFLPKFSSYTSVRLVNAVGWGTFLLLEVFYSGALTMFFSTELSLPFETIVDVMRAYPDYKLITQTNNAVYFIYKVEEGDPDYVAFWDRYNNKKEETIFKKTTEALQRMETERVVPIFQGGSLKGYAKNNPGVLSQFSLKVFGQGKPEYMNLILNKNSPLAPAWKQASLLMMEKGVGQKLDKLWLGELKSSSSIEDSLMVLKPTQLVLVFFVVSFSLILVLVVLGFEQIWNQVHKSSSIVSKSNS